MNLMYVFKNKSANYIWCFVSVLQVAKNIRWKVIFMNSTSILWYTGAITWQLDGLPGLSGGSQVVYSLSKIIVTNINQYNGIDQWCSSQSPQAGFYHTDVVLSFRCVCRCGICRCPDVFGLIQVTWPWQGWQCVSLVTSFNKNQNGCQSENLSFASLFHKYYWNMMHLFPKIVLKLILWIYT